MIVNPELVATLRKYAGVLPELARMLPSPEFSTLLVTIASKPDCITSRLVAADWMTEYGEELHWQVYLDANPTHHEVRERFGLWLVERGDVRGEGMRALAVLGKIPMDSPTMSPGAMAGLPDGCFEWWWLDLTHQDSDMIKLCHRLPVDWLDVMESSYRYRQGDSYSVDFITRHEAESAAALAFTHLPPSRQAELLQPQTKGNQW